MEDIEWDAIAKWIVTIFLLGLLIGGVVLSWMNILGPAFNQANYSNFNNSPQHLQAVAQQFSRDCQQIAESTDPATIKAIENDISGASSTIDLHEVQMPDGTRLCVNKAINDVAH